MSDHSSGNDHLTWRLCSKVVVHTVADQYWQLEKL